MAKVASVSTSVGSGISNPFLINIEVSFFDFVFFSCQTFVKFSKSLSIRMILNIYIFMCISLIML